MADWKVERFVAPRVPKHRCSFPEAAEFGIGSLLRCPDCDRRWRRTPEGWTRLLTAAQRRRHAIVVAVLAVAAPLAAAAGAAGWQGVVPLVAVCVTAVCVAILVVSMLARRVPVDEDRT